MKVIHLSIGDAGGGAARSAQRLHRGLRSIGVDSNMLVGGKGTADDSVRVLTPRALQKVIRVFRRKWLSREMGLQAPPNRYEVFSSDRSALGGLCARDIGDADLVNLHWIAGLFDYRAFFRAVTRRMPLVWTLHDMNPFTGGCHYDAGCGRFTKACGSCPQWESDAEKDFTRKIWRRKEKAFRQLPDDQLTIVTPSRWLADECRQSSLLGRFPVEVIPYGLDTETFQPADRACVRRLLGIPQEAWVVLFVAASLSPRKGFQLLRESIDYLRDIPNLYLLAIGANASELPQGIPSMFLPPTKEDRMLAWTYSAADVFVAPSLQDNLPNTVLESLACGTPVAAFDIGGMPDMVRPGTTGALAKPGDASSLAAAIRDLRLDSSERERLSFACRQVIVSEYALNIQAERYRQLYEGKRSLPCAAV